MSSQLDPRSYVVAATVAGGLATAPEVTARWSEESACEGMTVGGLAHHLAGQAANTVRLLGEPGGADPIPLLEHYRRARWVTAGLDEEFNTSIRDGSNEQAAGGPDALAEQVRRDLDALPGVLEGRRDPDTVLIPWQGWSLATGDFLVTRAMEMVVHSDDLAASVGVETPEFPDDVVAAVLALLSGVAVERHGQAALVRALSRPQRAPSSVSAF